MTPGYNGDDKRDEEYTFFYENDNVKAYKHKRTEIVIELCCKIFGTAEEILKCFDFTVMKFSYYKEEVPDELEFEPFDFDGMEELSERIIEKSGFGEEYEDWFISNGEGVTCRDFLSEVKGYCLIHNPAGYGGYIVSNVKPLTKKQKEFLYGYFMDIGDKFKADQYMD